MNGVLDTAREQQDLDSMEHVNGRPNGTDEAKSRGSFGFYSTMIPNYGFTKMKIHGRFL